MVLADFSLGAVTAMVHFLYSGELISDRTTLPELRTIASQLGLDALKRHVVRSLKWYRSGVSETQPQDDLEDRLEQERKKSQDGEQAIADECFITLSSLEEGFGEEKLEAVSGGDAVDEEQSLMDGDLHTPLQSPQAPSSSITQDNDILETLDSAAIDDNYFQCDLCQASCTDSEYLKRHK